MMNVAKGCSEAYYEFGVHCWDYCAASVVVTEAGGVCVDTTGCYLCFYWVKYQFEIYFIGFKQFY